jgi:hypothetical protein
MTELFNWHINEPAGVTSDETHNICDNSVHDTITLLHRRNEETVDFARLQFTARNAACFSSSVSFIDVGNITSNV